MQSYFNSDLEPFDFLLSIIENLFLLWVWANSGSWQWTGRPGVLRSVGSPRVGHNERLNWTPSFCPHYVGWNFSPLTQPLVVFSGSSTEVTFHYCFLYALLQWYHHLCFYLEWFSQSISVTQPCLTLCYPMDCSTPGFPIHHQLLELAQTHVYQVGDAIQPSHPLLAPSPPALNLSQHQSLF